MSDPPCRYLLGFWPQDWQKKRAGEQAEQDASPATMDGDIPRFSLGACRNNGQDWPAGGRGAPGYVEAWL